MSPPHSPGQRELIESPDSIVLLGGGRYGKTEAGVRRINRGIIREPGLYFWVGLSWQSASMSKAWRILRNQWRDALTRAGLNHKEYINLSKHEIALPNGSLQNAAGRGPTSRNTRSTAPPSARTLAITASRSRSARSATARCR